MSVSVCVCERARVIFIVVMHRINEAKRSAEEVASSN